MILGITVRTFVVFALIIAVFLFMIHHFLARKMMYPINLDASLPTMKGTLVKAVGPKRTGYGYLTEGKERLVVLFHGNAMAMVHMEDIARGLRSQGTAFLFIEYPGYGVAEAHSPTEKNLIDDARLVIEKIQSEYGFSQEQTTGLGWSLGTGVVVGLTPYELFGRLILISALTSMTEVAEDLFVPVLPRLLVPDKFECLEHAQNFLGQVLILHGQADELIPYSHSVRLQGAFNQAELRPVRAGHNDVFAAMKEADWQAMRNFSGSTN